MKQKKEYLSKETLLKGIETIQQCYSEHEADLSPMMVKMAVTALNMMKEFVNVTPGEDVIPVRCGKCDYHKDSECTVKFDASGEPLTVSSDFYCGDAKCKKNNS